MTSLAGALADASKLTTYQGRDVLHTSIAIRNAGDGLSEAMAIDPEELTLGSTVYVVLECEVDKHTHLPIKDTEALSLKQVLKAGTATLVERALVGELLDEQAKRVERAKDAANGQGRMDVEAEHREGKHADGLVVGCAECQAERDAEEAEGKAKKK